MADNIVQHIINTIKNRIYGHGKGWCFTLSHFSDLDNYEAAKKALQRLCKQGVIRRIAFDLYEFPRTHPILGIADPSMDNAAKALAEKNKIKLQPTGAQAANLIGLSEQVPARMVNLTDGHYKKIKIGDSEIVFRKTLPRYMKLAGTHMGLIIEALRYFGKKNLTPELENKIQNQLQEISDKHIDKAIRFAPLWISNLLKKLRKP